VGGVKGNVAPGKADKIRRAYQFLLGHETAGTSFSAEALEGATGWEHGTFKTYLKKKWSRLVQKEKTGRTYRVSGIAALKEAEFVRLMSQKDELSADPKKPLLEPKVEMLVRKAREAALLGLHIYNSPTTIFRTEGYSVMMVIAWTSLFHAIFEQRKVPYLYLDKKGAAVVIDGDEKAWELGACVAEFYKGTASAVCENLKFFISLRNKIEHRYVPSIHAHVAGECQALLFNFDELLTQEFGNYFAIRESLAIPLQTANHRTPEQTEVVKKLQARHFDEVRTFIDNFRSTLADEVFNDEKFSFRVYLVQRVGNHRNSSDLAIEFVRVTSENAADLQALTKQIVAVRERQVSVVSAGLLKPSGVVAAVAAKLKEPFSMHHHTLAWARYKVRPTGEFSATGCDSRYCIADVAHQDYLYTPAWIVLLVDKLSHAGEYAALTKKSGQAI
jgi:Protein of unknown function (DUF3644)